MSKTEVSGKQLKDGSVELVDLSPALAGDINTLKSDVTTLQTDVAAKADAGTLASVATSGSYNDLSNKPTIPSLTQVESDISSLDVRVTSVEADVATLQNSSVTNLSELGDVGLTTPVTGEFLKYEVDGWTNASLSTVATSGSYTDLTNKPSLFSGDYVDLANKPTIPSVAGLASETYVDTAVAAVVNSAPAVLDTLNELSAALGNDENFATTVAGQIGVVAADVAALDVRATSVEADVAALQNAGVPNLSELSGVAITTPSSGQVLKYDGLGWVNAADSTFSGVYADLTGKPTLFDGAYSSLTGTPSIPANLDDLSDVTLTSPSNGQVLSYNGTAWVNSAAASAGASDLDGLSDVTITSAAKGHFLAHNGTSFVNTRTIEADVAATVPLTVKGAASQSGNLFNIANSADSNLVAVTSSGAAYFNGGGWNSAPVVITGEIGNNPAFNIRGVVAGGSGSYGLLRIMGSGTGIIDFETSNSAGGSWNGRILGGSGLITIGTSSGASRGYPAWFGGWDATYPSLSLVALNAAAKGLVIKGAASQTASLFEVQNSSSQILNKIGSDGSVSMYDSAGANGYTVSNSTGNEKHTLASQKALQITQPGAYGVATTFSIGADDTVDEKGKWQIRYGSGGSSGAFVNFRPGYQDGNRFGGVGIMVPDDMYVKARLHVHNVSFPTQGNYADVTGLLIQNYDNQSGTNAFEIQSHTNVKQFAINKQGQVQAVSAATKALVVKGAASQTANFIEVIDSGDVEQFSVGTAWHIRLKPRFFPSGNTAHYLRVGFGGNGDPSNVMFGALAGNLTGTNTYQSTVVGASACTGDNPRNTAVGYAAGSGYDNTYIGHSAGSSTTTGNNNVCLGGSAGSAITTGASNTFVGKSATGAATASNQIALGSGATTLGASALAIGVSASAAASCMDIRFGGASRITGDSSGNVAIANTLHAKRYTETVANAFNTSLAPSSGTLTVDTSLGNAVLGALNAAVTTWAFTNVPTDNSKVTTVTAVLAGNASYTYGDACSVNGVAVSGGIMWSGGSAPTATAGTDIITFVIVKDSAGTVKVFGSATTNFS